MNTTTKQLTFNSFHTTQKINLHHCSSFFSNFFLLLLRPLLLHHQANFHWSPPPPRHPLFPPAQEAGSPPGKGWTPHHFPECSNVIISCAHLYSQFQLTLHLCCCRLSTLWLGEGVVPGQSEGGVPKNFPWYLNLNKNEPTIWAHLRTCGNGCLSTPPLLVFDDDGGVILTM